MIEKTDRHGDSYYVGGLNVPITVDLSKVSFFVFHPSDDNGSRPKLMIRRKWRQEMPLDPGTKPPEDQINDAK
jgi:hypothetical protein